jgi:hypothetical protein
MSARRIAAIAVGALVGLAACGKSMTRPDPNAYALQFVPESLAMTVGSTGEVLLFATQASTTGVTNTTDQTGVDNTTSTDNIIIRNVEWGVDNGTIASVSATAVSLPRGGASVTIACRAPGSTNVFGTVTLDSEQRLTKALPVTCAAP